LSATVETDPYRRLAVPPRMLLADAKLSRHTPKAQRCVRRLMGTRVRHVAR
jgi:hypothetical protein